MIEIKSRIRRWGNSFGIIVPQKEVEDLGITEGEEVSVMINKDDSNILREMFGTFKFKKPTSKLIKEINEELDSGF